MKLLKFVPAILTFCLIIGIVLGFYIAFKPLQIFILLAILLLFLAVSYFISNKSFSDNIHFNVIAYLLFISIGIGSVTFKQYKNKINYFAKYLVTKNKAVLIICKQLKSNIYYDKYEAKVIQINNHKSIGKVLLNIKKDSLSKYEIDDKLFVNTNFKAINESKNPFQFNYKKYLEKQQIYYQITSKYKYIKHQKNTRSIYGIASIFRENIQNSLKKHAFSKDELAIINALILGQRQGVSKALIQSYQNAGAIHILAVSGLHVGVLFLLLGFIFKPLENLKKGKILKFIIIVSLLWMFALIAGLSASVVRAVTMFTALELGKIVNRKSNTLNNLFISMFLLLLINPLYLFAVGFQLSYLAVFSIVYFYPKFINFYNPKNIIIKKAWQICVLSFAAQLGILPLSLYYFHQFPSLFFVSSLVIIPALSFILGVGILVIILASLNGLPLILVTVYGFVIRVMNNFIRFIAKQEQFLFKEISFSILLLFASYLLLISSYRFFDKKTAKRMSFVLITILLIQMVFIYEKQQLQTKNEFIVFTKNRKTILAKKQGNKLAVWHNLDSLKNLTLIKNYRIGNNNLDVSVINSVKNSYKINTENILVIDSLGVYKVRNFQPKMVILTQSPKINLERLIKNSHPKLIIADASNYKSSVLRWKKTCKKENVKFYSTKKEGAFTVSF